MRLVIAVMFILLPPNELQARWTSVISESVGAKYYQRVLKEREIFTSAKLEETKQKGVLKYSFYTVAMVHATQRDCHSALNQFEDYDDLLPNVDSVKVDNKTQQISIEGGIWKYRLSSVLKFTKNERSEMRFTVIRGHFRGLQGKILIEPAEGSLGEQNSVIHFSGEMQGRKWPSKIVLTQGMKIALSIAARKMRSFIETKAKEHTELKGTKDVPKPKRFF